jgi:hypothetical protein
LTSPLARFGVKRSVLVMRELKAATCMVSYLSAVAKVTRARVRVPRDASPQPPYGKGKNTHCVKTRVLNRRFVYLMLRVLGLCEVVEFLEASVASVLQLGVGW